MKRDPWTDPDPQPGDFDAELENLDDLEVEVIPAGAIRVTFVRDDDPRLATLIEPPAREDA
jgi:hypothetical protein